MTPSYLDIFLLLQLLVVIFAICFLPGHIFMLWFHVYSNGKYFSSNWYILRTVGFVLHYLNSCINPVVLYCVSTSIRKQFNQLFCCCFRTRSTSVSSQRPEGRTGQEPVVGSRPIEIQSYSLSEFTRRRVGGHEMADDVG